MPSCNQAGCSAPVGGKCQQGHDDVSRCPHYQVNDALADEAEQPLVDPESGTSSPQEAQPTGAVSDRVSIHVGRQLSETDAAELTRRENVSVVVLAGMTYAGKTTLITSFFERMHAAPLPGFSFAGSQTILGFEERAYEGRLSSGRVEPDTSHTPLTDGTNFLHLSLLDRSGARRNILFSDISGEAFKRLKDNPEVAAGHSVLPRADHVAFVVDGEAVSDIVRRYSAVAELFQLAQSLVQSGSIGLGTNVQLVCAKWDAVEAADDAEQLKQYLETQIATFRQRFLPNLAGITTHRVAARPDDELAIGALRYGYGCDELLDLWVKASEARVPEATAAPEDPRNRLIDWFADLPMPPSGIS